MFIVGLGTRVPAQRHTQRDAWQALAASSAFAALRPRSKGLLEKVLHNRGSGIEARYFAPEPLAQVFTGDPDTLTAVFQQHAPALAIEAAHDALVDARLSAADIDGVIVSTCTGYLCPGLSGYVIEGLGLRQDALAYDLVGHGCGAALPNLQTAEALITARRARRVLSVCVEICSAAFYLDDDPGVLISACLFGDGAAAAVLAAARHGPARPLRWHASHSLTKPAQRDILRFEQRSGMLRNVLTPDVPRLAAQYADEVLSALLEEQKLTQSDIRAWCWHAAGRDVLVALQQRLQLEAKDMRWSRGVLKNHGNMSSPSVLFALKAARDGGAAPGWWWLSSFGAGFSSHGALLEAGGS